MGLSALRRAVRLVRARDPRHVAGDGVDLEVDLVAGLALVPVGHLKRVRDEQAVEAVAVDAVHRQRHAVEGHRALERDEAGEIVRRLEDELGGLAEILARDDGRQPVDMAAHQMAAEFVAELQRALQIDARTDRPVLRRGHLERLRRRLHREGRAACIVRLCGRHHRQADAVAGDRRADVDAVRVIGGSDRQAAHVVTLVDAGHPADIGHNSGKHDAHTLTYRRMTSTPTAAVSTSR